MAEVQEKYVNKSTARTLRILKEFCKCDGSLGITEISKRLSLTKNLVHRSLGVLVEEGLLLRNAATRRYELGPGTLWFSSSQSNSVDIKTVCLPFMLEIEKITGMTVSLQIPVGQFQIPVHGVDGKRSGLTRIVEGVPVPLHISSGSRAILAFMDKQEIESYIRDQSPLKKATRFTLTDPDDLRNDLERIRTEGFARGIEDHFLGVNAVAFPIFGEAKAPVGSLTVVASNASVPPSEVEGFVPEIRRVMQELDHYIRLQAHLPSIAV